ncbi:MAG: site-specific integrase [Methanoregula sp.]|uniref:site-specific integrase n=1 Tax=Methanoregula sp. TaxID=2052170 RepID=UPI003C76AAA9
MDVVAKFKRLDPVNLQYFTDYIRYLELKNNNQKTVESKLWKVYAFLIWFDFRDAKTAQSQDLENFYLDRKKTHSPVTAFGDLREMCRFFEWLLPGNNLVQFKPKPPLHEVPPEKVLQSVNVRSLLEVCESQRDRALVAIVWDSGARISEILNCNIGHVTFDRYGAVIAVTGKTGRRSIRLVSAVPDLQAWINIHPLKNDPEAPLFVTSRRRGTTTLSRLSIRRVQNLFARFGDLASCPRDTNPHAFRHGRLTVRGKQLTEAELREYAGWSKKSAMAAVYVHLSGRDIDNKILTVEGIKPEEEPIADPMSAQICPRCKKANSPDAMYCDRCSMALNDDALHDLDAVKNVMSNPDDLIAYAEWRKRQSIIP